MAGNIHSVFRTSLQEAKVGKQSKNDVKLKDIQLIAQLPGEGTMKYWTATASTKTGSSVNVIAKTISENAQMKEHLDFRALAGGLSSLPKHNNIVEILGVSIEDVPYHIYFEHLQGGKLKDFLLRNYQESNAPVKMSQSGDTNTMQLSRFCLDIADGLMFLTQRDYCHPALRTGKVLLSEKGVCKLYDIWPKPMSSDRITQLFQKPHPPVAWLSPEAIFLGQYTDKSDVWNFAVLLWEIYSLGQTPYSGLSCDEIEQEIRANRNLEQPLSCPGAIFGMMLASWNTSMNKRPELSDWRQKLLCILQSANPGDNAKDNGVNSGQYFTLENKLESHDYKEQYNVCYEGVQS